MALRKGRPRSVIEQGSYDRALISLAFAQGFSLQKCERILPHGHPKWVDVPFDEMLNFGINFYRLKSYSKIRPYTLAELSAKSHSTALFIRPNPDTKEGKAMIKMYKSSPVKVPPTYVVTGIDFQGRYSCSVLLKEVTNVDYLSHSNFPNRNFPALSEVLTSKNEVHTNPEELFKDSIGATSLFSPMWSPLQVKVTDDNSYYDLLVSSSRWSLSNLFLQPQSII